MGNEGRKALRLGVIVDMGRDPEAAVEKVHTLGLPTCQIFSDNIDIELAAPLRKALDGHGIEVTSLVVGGPGREAWDFYEGPLTAGLTPRETRAARVEHVKKASEFAKRCGIDTVQTHCGFLPENPHDAVYKEMIPVLRELASYCRRNGQNFSYETGQETPITLVRTMKDVGEDNQGVNFDTANLIMYGKANPVDAIELLGPYILGVHAKDGFWPTDPRKLGQEAPIGQGKVDFPRVIERLKEMKYAGAVTIERETTGPEQMEDVKGAKRYLEGLIG